MIRALYSLKKPARATSKKLKFKNVHIPLIIIAITTLSSCGDWDSGGWNQIPELPVFKVQKGNYVSHTSYPTQLEGIQDIEIRAKVDGYIQEIFVDEGQYVNKGQLLFQLEANVIAENTAASASAIKSFEASVNAAQIEVNRLKPLVEQKVISEIQLQTAEAKLQVAQAQLNQAISSFSANQANENYTKIVSPVDGFIGKINHRKGSLVGPATVNALTTISNTKQVYAYFSIGEREINQLTQHISGKNLDEKLQKLPELELILSDGNTYPLSGKVDASTGKISTKTGTMQLRAIFDNPDGALLSGNTGTIKIPRHYENCIAVPNISTLNMQGIKMVYVLSEGDTLRMRPIQPLGSTDQYLLIASGLEAGEMVLAQGLGKVYPNSVVIPQEVKMDSLVNTFSPLFK